MSKPNQNIPIGHSSKLIYDPGCYCDKLDESVGPLLYKLNPNQIKNCNACLSTFGPRSSNGPMSYGVSTTVGNKVAPSQQLVDVESILSNRNVLLSKCKDGQVNDIDVTKFKLKNAKICNHFLDPESSLLTLSPKNNRGVSINRFYNLPKNPQANIFWDFSINTRLEARDNFKIKIPKLINYDPTYPEELKGRPATCQYNCNAGCSN